METTSKINLSWLSLGSFTPSRANYGQWLKGQRVCYINVSGASRVWDSHTESVHGSSSNGGFRTAINGIIEIAWEHVQCRYRDMWSYLLRTEDHIEWKAGETC